MVNDVSRVMRGQVFMFDPARYQALVLNTESAPRLMHMTYLGTAFPVLVVSVNDDGFTLCNVIPIKSDERRSSNPNQVEFTNYGGEHQYIEVSRIMTVDSVTLGNYLYTLNDSIMMQVEEAMVVQFAIRPSVKYLDITLDNVAHHLQALVEKILAEKGAAVANNGPVINQGIPVNAIEDSAAHLAHTIENLVTAPNKQEQSVVQASEKSGINEASAKPKRIKPHRGGKQPLSSDELNRRAQFVADCDKMPLSEVAVKYNIPLDKVMSTKYYYKHCIAKLQKGNQYNDRE